MTLGRNQLANEPLLVTAKQAAALCGKSLRTWRAWDAAGWIPRPVRLGRSTLWRTAELRA
jgi:predicted DNA-binding transcriptional regulator AlpA